MSSTFTPNPDTWYVLTFEHSDKVLGIHRYSKDNGGNATQQEATGSRCQQWKFEQMESGWYRLRARHSDKALGIADRSTDNGANLHQWTASDSHSQQWALEASEGGYVLRSRHSNKLLTVTDASTDDGANVRQWGYHSVPQKRVQLTVVLQPIEKKWYNLVFEHSGKALSVEDLSKDNGIRTVQEALVGYGAPRQQWSFEHVDGDWYMLRSRHSGKALDVEGRSISDGATIHQWDVHHGDNQQWRIVPVKGRYMLMSRKSGRVVDVSGGRTTDNVKVHQWGTGTQPHRRMSITQIPDSVDFEPEAGAWYSISFAHSGKVLDVHGWNRDDGGNVIQYTNYDNSNQLFSFEKVGTSDYYLIRARHSGKVLDVADGSTEEGANVEQRAEQEGRTSQHWKVISNGKGDAYAIRARHSDLALCIASSELGDRANVEQRGQGHSQNNRVHITRVVRSLDDLAPRVLTMGADDGPVRLPPLRVTRYRDTTMEIWVRPDAVSGTRTILSIGSGNSDRSLIVEQSNDDVRFIAYNEGVKHEIVRASSVLSTDQWTHVAVTIDTSGGGAFSMQRNFKVRLYIDGALEDTENYTSNESGMWMSGGKMYVKIRGKVTDALLRSNLVGQPTIGGRSDGTYVFQGKLAEARFWTTARDGQSITDWMNRRARGSESSLAACYSLDRIVGGRMLDTGGAGAHAVAGEGTHVGDASDLPLPSTASAGIHVRTKMTHEWLPKSAFDETTLDRLLSGYGELSGLESLEVDDLGRTSGERVEVSVYETVLEAYDADERRRAGQLVRVDLDGAQIVVVDDDGGQPRLETWAEGRHALRASSAGRIRLRFVASGLTCAGVEARHAGMPDSAWVRVSPDDKNSTAMLNVTADSLRNPGNDLSSPLASDDEDNAIAVASMINKLARVGVPLETLEAHDQAQSGGDAGFWKNVEKTFEKIGDAVEDAVEDAADDAWNATKAAGELVAKDLDSLIRQIEDIDPRIGSEAILDCVSHAESLEVISSAVEELSNVVQLIGTTASGAFRVVINSIEDAALALGAFFKRVGASIKDFVNMLADSLDWGRFLNTAESIYSEVTKAFNNAKTAVQTEMGVGRGATIGDEVDKIKNWADGGKTLGDLTGLQTPELPGLEMAEYVMDQLQRILASAKFDIPLPDFELPDLRADWLDDIKDALPDTEVLTTSFPDLPADDLRGVVVDLWEAAGSTIMGQPYQDLLGGVESGISGIKSALTSRIDVPWLTEVIEQTMLGGENLNLLRLLSVVAAIPIVIAEAAHEAGSELMSFDADEEAIPLELAQFGLAFLNSMLSTARAVDSVAKSASGKSLLGPRLTIVHGFFVMVQGAIECRKGGNDSDAKTIAAGILNLLYGLVNGSIGVLEHLVSSKRNSDLTESESDDVSALLLFGDVVLAMGYVGIGLHTAITATDDEDVGSGVADVNYWVTTWMLTGVGAYASSRDKAFLEMFAAGGAVGLNIVYTVRAAASGVV